MTVFLVMGGIGLFCILAAVAIHHATMPHPMENGGHQPDPAARKPHNPPKSRGEPTINAPAATVTTRLPEPDTEQRLLPLIDVGVLLYQELSEFVDDAKLACNDDNALACSQELLRAWEAAYQSSGLTEDDHFTRERQAALRMADRVRNHPLADRYQSAEQTP